ncbi:L-lactate dehydrogenase B chain-like [Scaptodrosophila lebanonensis]|uniref:L-lactate dehydrogenase n=1 Tax=Drosophila lebanonensis TaxID=7225 RepID=A0A6J2TVC3_DROLE|nr:L-lactate dehydrogenase B chain-like [Scaptodrosophila lebanonensis]
MLAQWSHRCMTRFVCKREFSDECPPPPTKFQTKHLKEIGKRQHDEKISVVGVGQVGIACSAFILQRRLTNHLVFMDIRKDWIKAEALDFLHASSTTGSQKITATVDGKEMAGSKYVVITTGLRPTKDQSRLDVAQKTTDMIVKIMPPLLEYCPNATFIVVSNPADVITWLIQKLGKLPKHRCLSTGCHLDSLRFRYFISKRLGVAPSAVEGYIIGEHGNSSVPVWSSVMVGGIALLRIMPDIGTESDKEKWSKVHEQVVKGASTVSSIKTYTNWAIGMTVSDVISALKDNSGRILSVATDVQGFMGIEDSVVLSLPCILTSDGIAQVVELPLTDFEKDMLKKSVDTLIKAQCSIKF